MNLSALPKVDLHRHLEGSVRFETFVELARETGIRLPLAELRRRTSMRRDKPGFDRFLSKFELYRGLYPSRDWIERVAFEAVQDAKEDGVVYLELRYSPTHFGRRLRAKGEDVADWVARGARRASLEVRFIATYGRNFTPRENEPTTRAVEGTTLFSGLDLAGHESRSALPFAPLFRRLQLPLTLHAGEAGGPENVREAVEILGAQRIGHGLAAAQDPKLLHLARRRGIHFEICLTSETQTRAAPSWKSHPAVKLREEGIRHSLNTDDPSVSCVTLSEELGRAARLGWSREDLKLAQLEAVRAAFVEESAKRRLRKRLREAWGP